MSAPSISSARDVIDYLKTQHETIRALFIETLDAADAETRQDAFTRLRTMLAVHETAEEMVVHPRARNDGAAGDEIVDARLREEHEAKEQLSTLESMDVASDEFLTALTAFRETVLEHAEREEADEFPKLARDLDENELKTLAAAVRAAEAIAPTRPHPGVESAKLNFAVGPFASMLDRARDLIGAALR